MELDHVVLAAADLDDAARELQARHGLASVAGGRHPGWGTENRIVPLGDAYLELVAVADEEEAACTVFGRRVASAREAPFAPLAWAVRTGDLDAHAARLGLEIEAGERARPDGTTLRWRLAGVVEAAAEPFLPFFIEWEPGATLPGAAAVRHPAGDVRVERLALSGDGARLAAWLGGTHLAVTVRPGAPALVGVALSGGLSIGQG
ncbi:MAG TPA: VOC family protein [Gaiellaceae bacterium]